MRCSATHVTSNVSSFSPKKSTALEGHYGPATLSHSCPFLVQMSLPNAPPSPFPESATLRPPVPLIPCSFLELALGNHQSLVAHRPGRGRPLPAACRTPQGSVVAELLAFSPATCPAWLSQPVLESNVPCSHCFVPSTQAGSCATDLSSASRCAATVLEILACSVPFRRTVLSHVLSLSIVCFHICTCVLGFGANCC